MGKEKTSEPNGQLLKSTKISKTKEPWLGEEAQHFTHVGGNVLIWDSYL